MLSPHHNIFGALWACYYQNCWHFLTLAGGGGGGGWMICGLQDMTYHYLTPHQSSTVCTPHLKLNNRIYNTAGKTQVYEILSKVNASINPPLQSRSSEARDIGGWRRALDHEAESQHLERGFRQTPGSNQHPLEVVFTIITPLDMSFQRVVFETVCSSEDSALRCLVGDDCWCLNSFSVHGIPQFLKGYLMARRVACLT